MSKSKKVLASVVAAALAVSTVPASLVVSAAETMAAPSAAAAGKITEQQLRDKDYILYAVNCGSNNPAFPSNHIDRAEQFQNVAEPSFPDRLANQIPDQVFNADATQDADTQSEYSWGIVDPDSAANPVKRNTGGNGWPYDTNWQTNVGSKNNAAALAASNPEYDAKGGITYRFEIPEREDTNAVNKYNVRLGFHTGGRNRFLNVYANDELKIDSLLLVANVKYVEGFQTEAITDPATGKQFIEIRVAADTLLENWLDGDSDVQVKYLEISAEPVYTQDDLASLLTTTEDEDLQPLKSGYQNDGQGTSSFTAPYDSAQPNADDLKTLAAARAAAQTVNANGSATADEVYDAYSALKNAFDDTRFIYHYTGITGTNGAKIFDNNGTLIQAHGPQIQAVSIDTMPDADKALDQNGDGKLWAWCGEDKTNGLLPSGVHIYYSDDLYNWIDKGLGFSTYEDEADFEEKCQDADSVYGKYYNVENIQNDPDFTNIYGEDFQAFANDNSNYNIDSPEDALANVKYDLSVADSAVYERPKMVFNESTQRWVIWYHADGPIRGNPTSASYSKAKAGVAISETADPAGPYKYLGSFRMSPGRNTGNPGMARDMNLFVDDKDANGDGALDAYLIYASNENRDLTISLLDSTYTKLAVPQAEQVQGTDVSAGATYNIAATNSKESPAPVKYNGKYYIIYSGTTGWAPNTNKYTVSDGDSILGPYHEVGNPFVSGDGINQSNGNAFTTQSSYVIPYDVEKGLYIYFGDRWFNPDDNRDISQSRYVMTPMQFVGDQMRVLPAADWTTEDLAQYETVDVLTELPTETGSMADLMANLPTELEVKRGGEATSIMTPVQWDPYYGAEQPMGQVTVTGKLTELSNIPIRFTVNVYPESTALFIDAGSNSANESDYFNKLKTYATGMLNKDGPSDQAYTDGSWGYSSTLGGDNDNVDMSKYGTSGTDIYETGYWAHGGKSISYKATLEPGTYTVNAGLKDWWNSRTVKFTVSDGSSELGSQSLTTSTSGGITGDITFTLDAKTTVTMTASKQSGGDPVLSWIGIKKTADDQILSVEPISKTTFLKGSTPELPATVKATTVGGETVNRAVTWNMQGVDLNATPFKLMEIKGTVAGTTLPATATLQMIPENLEYFIDCNNSESETYADANQWTGSGLINTLPDQVKEDTNNWGNTSADYGARGGSAADPYSSGWYASAGSLSYQLTLPAGTHDLSFGFYDWWNVTRPTNIYYSYDGQQETKLCAVTVPGSKAVVANGQITLSEEKTVTLKLTSSEGGGPILSWLSAAKVPSAAPDSVSVKTQPTKTTYNPGDTLDLTGLVLEAAYSDGTTEEITEGYTVSSNVDMSTAGTKTVTVTYEGKSIDLTIQVKAVNKTVLNDFIVKAQSLVDDGTVDGMVESAKKVYLATLDKAKEVAANENATYAEVMDVQTKLLVCITSVSLQAGDKEALGSLLESCKYFTDEILAANYVEAGQAEYRAALAAANKVYADGDVFQGDVDKAHSDLSTAVLALRMKADKSALQALLNQVNGIDLSLYTEESVALLHAAMENVNSVLANEALSVDDQATVDEAVKTLQAAVDGLELKQPAETPADPTDPNNSTGSSASINSGSSSTSPKAGTTSKPSAKTGDASPMAGAAALALAAGAAAVLIKRRKK